MLYLYYIIFILYYIILYYIISYLYYIIFVLYYIYTNIVSFILYHIYIISYLYYIIFMLILYYITLYYIILYYIILYVFRSTHVNSILWFSPDVFSLNPLQTEATTGWRQQIAPDTHHKLGNWNPHVLSLLRTWIIHLWKERIFIAVLLYWRF